METNNWLSLLNSDASDLDLNLYRITKTLECLLAWYFVPGNQISSSIFCRLCISLSRGINYAIAYGQTPSSKAIQLLHTLMKKIDYQNESDDELGVVIVLVITVKNACEFGWFENKETQELLTIAHEIEKMYCTLGSTRPSFSHHSSSLLNMIMQRFYPSMKLGPIIASIEAKKIISPNKKFWLLVAETDNIETSACLINPQDVNFLVNGEAINTRTLLGMDHQPQMPTSVGEFDGNYIILVAYMSYVDASLPPELPPDYVQSTLEYSDSDIMEGESRISLNCPIGLTRIKTPVKGRTCKHFQCFDFDNFIEINCYRPLWRCPHCNEYVSYTDICLDRNMVEILKKVGENVVEVIVHHADGSLKEVLLEENDSSGLSSRNTGLLH
ncbi:transcription factor-like protein [Medicago truncatula]|uniref:Transcription factor-like protein n=1 Tax=Medicago truncatula TaxID=3880 RepID=A0A072UAX1_MEDTR|nr:transcription factor-like protein [Medicago truncatula]